MADLATQGPVRTDQVLARAHGFFVDALWESEPGAAARARLAGVGIEERTLRELGVGYAPGDARRLPQDLLDDGFAAPELEAAGVATRSGRDHLHGLFHARIVFPLEGPEGELAGFAGLATHLGPSWPLWLTSADGGRLDTGTAIFALAAAKPAIVASRRVLIVRDCVQVLGLHQGGHREAVGVIRSPITREHSERLAALIGGDVELSRRDGRLGVVAAPVGIKPDAEDYASLKTPAGYELAGPGRPSRREHRSQGGGTPDLGDGRYGPLARPAVYVAAVLVGSGVPIGLLLLAEPDQDSAGGSAPALNLMILGVAVVYALLTGVVAFLSPRLSDPDARRMRFPWARGRDEWQPRGWTANWLEELLVGAALVSAVACLALLMTLGGFLG